MIDENSTYEEVFEYIKRQAYYADLSRVIEFDDLFQEFSLTWLECKTSYQKLDYSQGSFKAYLINALRFKKNNLLRGFYKEPTILSLDYDYSHSHKPYTLSSVFVDIENDLERDISREEILLMMLNHRHGIIADYLLRGHTHQEIAERFNMSQQAVSKNFKKMVDEVKKKIFLEEK